jgi:hypothetical protein
MRRIKQLPRQARFGFISLCLLLGQVATAATGVVTALTGMAELLAGLVDSFGPADEAVQRATDYINDYGKALEDAAVAGQDVVTAAEVTAIELYTQAFKDWMDVNRQFLTDIDNSGQTLAMMERLTMDMAMASGVGAAELAVLAEKVRLAGGDFDDFVSAIQGMIATGIDLKAMAMRYVGSFAEIGGATDEAVRTMDRFASGTPKMMSRAVMDMKATIKAGKAGIIEQFRDLAWQSKHPFAEVRYADWLAEKHKQAMKRSETAARKGKPGLAAQWRRPTVDDQNGKAHAGADTSINPMISHFFMVLSSNLGLSSTDAWPRRTRTTQGQSRHPWR